jgi:hypothetical protein
MQESKKSWSIIVLPLLATFGMAWAAIDYGIDAVVFVVTSGQQGDLLNLVPFVGVLGGLYGIWKCCKFVIQDPKGTRQVLHVFFNVTTLLVLKKRTAPHRASTVLHRLMQDPAVFKAQLMQESGLN